MPESISPERTKKVASMLKAYMLDSLLWGYAMLAGRMVVYERLIMGDTSPIFLWSHALLLMALGSAAASILFLFPSCSIGKRAQGIDKRREGRPLWLEPYAVFGCVLILITVASAVHII